MLTITSIDVDSHVFIKLKIRVTNSMVKLEACSVINFAFEIVEWLQNLCGRIS